MVIMSPVGAIEYTDCISVEGKDPQEDPGYDTKQYHDNAPAMPDFCGMWSTLSLSCLQVNSDLEWLHLIGSYIQIKKNSLTFKLYANK